MMQQVQLGIFVAAMIALVVCGCILTRKPEKAPLATASKRRRIAANIAKLPELLRT